jgi:hypothetical protein
MPSCGEFRLQGFQPAAAASSTRILSSIVAGSLPVLRAEAGLGCADHAQGTMVPERATEPATERATERVAVLMTPTEKAAFADRAHSLGISLGQFFREAGSAYANRNAQSESRALAEEEALEAALQQLELSTNRTERILDAALADVRAALSHQP